MKLVWCPPGFVTMEQVQLVKDAATTPVETTEKTDDDDVVIGEPVPEPIPATRAPTHITPVKALVTRGYWLGKYEVSQSEWRQVMATEPWKGKNFTNEGDDFPATFVRWVDAMEFCRNLTERERNAGRLTDGGEYTLPTEAQWERACRARTESRFNFGDDESKLGEYAWFGGNPTLAGELYAHRIGLKKPNPWGLHDMHGNVWEWCRDYYAEKLPGGRDPEVTEKASYRVLRGGGWSNVASDTRSARRGWNSPDHRGDNSGFRVARSSVQPIERAEPGAQAPSAINK
jgi:formylglycine-generating enzyme required for sulfatase activity